MNTVEKIVLFKPNGKAVKLFDTLPEAQKFCLEKRLCNAAWVARSLETGERFYNTKLSGRTKSHNNYRGFNWYVKVKPLKIKEEQTNND